MICKIGFLALFLSLAGFAGAEPQTPLPPLKSTYPRMIQADKTRQRIDAMLLTPAGKEAMEGIRRRIDPLAQRHTSDPQWIVSRLQMYWHSHATEVYINGDVLDHVAGRAPVPTVRFTATRGTQTDYARPSLDQIAPYSDSLGLWMRHKPSGKMEWVDPRKTGRNVESMNLEILNLARDAAFLYWQSGEERYARFASDLFDCYVTGLYYRDVPIDINHGQQQTLVGMTSFEVIHEDAVVPCTEIYDYLHDYLATTRSEKIAIYDAALKKWADVIVAHGVPHNNWDLLQAQFIFRLALVLDDDEAYTDRRGRSYYLNQVLNDSSIRQWSLARLIDYGFDAQTGLWKECPNYATMVVSEFLGFVQLLDETLGLDLVAAHPVLAQAVRTVPQYLFPNGWITAWGDSHYTSPRTDFYPRMIANAQRYGKQEQERFFTAMYRCFDPAGAQTALSHGTQGRLPDKVASFTSMPPLQLDTTVVAGRTTDYVTPTFWSEGVSWFAARTGMDADRDLMMSIAGSDGNHMHANGISLELYGKGYVQAPDLGRGSGYTSLDYAEFYSQFPAHNTVCVDGVSAYPVMKSCHPIHLEGCYPLSEERSGIYEGVLYGDFSFLEPETQSDQHRQTLIVNTDPAHPYYVDLFRSRRRDQKDQTHDYFYHNIGQHFTLNVATQPTEELAFAGGHLYAYSYLWGKSSAQTERDIEGIFTMSLPDSSACGMRMWMRGEKDRSVFKALSPKIDALTRTKMPYDVEHSPCQTYVARQYGEAWERPFVALYEPFRSDTPRGIARVEYPACNAVAIRVQKVDGRQDLILAADQRQEIACGSVKANAVLAVVSDDQYFMARGQRLETDTLRITTQTPATVALIQRDGEWFYTADAPCRIRIGRRSYALPASKIAPVR